jgi:serine/threonine protein kinase
MSPETIGRYKLVRELGRGAIGVVYEAADPNLGRSVALKVIQSNTIGTNPEEVALRFKNEARATGALSHPNIVTVFDAGEDHGLLYIAMELLQGETLEAHLARQRTLSPEKAIDITSQVCAALDYASSKGIVHRDVKPANIMLLPDGTAKIADFGLARTAEAITMTGQVMGTPHYMSPEQVRGGPVDARSDLFSVGVMLYEMLTGERPFEGQSLTTIMYKIVHEEPTPPRALHSGIAPQLSAAVQRMLAKSPEDRYQTGAELVAALKDYKNQSVISASAAGRASGRRGTIVWVTVACILVGLLAAFLLTRHGKPKADESANTSAIAQPPNPAPAPVSPSTPREQASPPPSNATATNGDLLVKQAAQAGKTTATLTVNSDPPTAHIFLDGKPTGLRTPAQLQLTRGNHRVAVEMASFQPASTRFRVQGGEELEFSPRLVVQVPSVNIPGINVPGADLGNLNLPQKELQSVQAWQQWAKAAQGGTATGGNTILVTSHPSGAEIWINGDDSGKVTPAIIPEKPGKYHLRVELDGYQSEERDVTVEEKHSGFANITLKPVNDANQ